MAINSTRKSLLETPFEIEFLLPPRVWHLLLLHSSVETSSSPWVSRISPTLWPLGSQGAHWGKHRIIPLTSIYLEFALGQELWKRLGIQQWISQTKIPALREPGVSKLQLGRHRGARDHICNFQRRICPGWWPGSSAGWWKPWLARSYRHWFFSELGFRVWVETQGCPGHWWKGGHDGRFVGDRNQER